MNPEFNIQVCCSVPVLPQMPRSVLWELESATTTSTYGSSISKEDSVRVNLLLICS